MNDAKLLETGILSTLESVAADQWRSFSLGDFRNLVIQRVPPEQATDARLVDALIALKDDRSLTIRKLDYPNKGENSYNSILAAVEDHYTTDFFYVGEFQLRITHKGRRLLSDGKQSALPGPSGSKLDDLLPINRRAAFDSDADQAVAEAVKLGESLSLIMIDIDHFKSVNDTHGHQIGDEVLVGIASLITRRMRRKGTVYRYGGEEIIVILPNFDAVEAEAIAEAVRKEIETAEIGSKKLHITASFGVASLPEHGKDRSKLVQLADAAMYSAKSLGRNLVRIAGEPHEIPNRQNNQTQRKQPTGELTAEEEANIRRTHFSGNPVPCPRDGAVLRISESHRMGYRSPHLAIACPLCGLHIQIPGILIG